MLFRDFVQSLMENRLSWSALKKGQTDELLREMFAHITDLVLKGNEVNITAFGKFYLSRRTAEGGTNERVAFRTFKAAKRHVE